LTDLT